jgi:hypothetical protein
MATLPRLVFSATTNWVDVTAPTFTSATIPAAGTSISLLFSEAVKFGAGSNGGFAITLSGGACTLTYASGANSNTLVYTTSRTVNSGETCSAFTYTQPTNGVEDIAGNDLATFTNQQASVTNNSTQGSLTVHAENTSSITTQESCGTSTRTMPGHMAYDPGANISLRRFTATLTKVGSVSGINYRAEVYTWTDPTLGTLLGTSSSVAGSDSWSDTEVDFDFSSGVSLSSGSGYCIVVRRADELTDNSNYLQFKMTTSGAIGGSTGVWAYDKTRQTFSSNDPKVKLWKS